MVKTITIDGREVAFKATAAVPRLYRIKFRRDILVDMMELEKQLKRNEAGKGDYPIDFLTIFENVAYIMAKHADPAIPSNIEEWIDTFETFSIYEVLPELLELWDSNVSGMSTLKKKVGKASGV